MELVSRRILDDFTEIVTHINRSNFFIIIIKDKLKLLMKKFQKPRTKNCFGLHNRSCAFSSAVKSEENLLTQTLSSHISIHNLFCASHA